jgi:hypothetical protein
MGFTVMSFFVGVVVFGLALTTVEHRGYPPSIGQSLTTHRRVEEALGDTVGVFIVIHMLMMIPMFGGPPDDGTFKGGRSKDDCKQTDKPMSPGKSDARIVDGTLT